MIRRLSRCGRAGRRPGTMTALGRKKRNLISKEKNPMAQPARPARGTLLRGGAYGQHVLPSEADDMRVQSMVQAIFTPGASGQPEDPQLVQRLLDYAPQPDRIGVDDWGRGLRADEVAEIWGTPMEGPDTRGNWLRRADEICRAWGKPLFGTGGLLPGSDAGAA